MWQKDGYATLYYTVFRDILAILPEFNQTEENSDPIHYEIDEKRVAILVFYFKNGRI